MFTITFVNLFFASAGAVSVILLIGVLVLIDNYLDVLKEVKSHRARLEIVEHSLLYTQQKLWELSYVAAEEELKAQQQKEDASSES